MVISAPGCGPGCRSPMQEGQELHSHRAWGVGSGASSSTTDGPTGVSTTGCSPCSPQIPWETEEGSRTGQWGMMAVAGPLILHTSSSHQSLREVKSAAQGHRAKKEEEDSDPTSPVHPPSSCMPTTSFPFCLCPMPLGSPSPLPLVIPATSLWLCLAWNQDKAVAGGQRPVPHSSGTFGQG